MKKLRSDAHWHNFTEEQQKKIQQWLFDDHFSYRKTHQLMQTELGLTCALSTIGPLYHYLAELRAELSYLNAVDAAGDVADSGVRLDKLRSASQLLIASKTLQTLMLGRASTEDTVRLGRLLLQSQTQEIARERMDLATESLKLRAMQPPFRLTLSKRHQAVTSESKLRKSDP